MRLIPQALLWCAVLGAAAAPALGQTVRIDNPFGGITVQVVAAGGLQIQASSPDRQVSAQDAATTQQPGLLVVQAKPADGARIDLHVGLPYGAALQARTKAGPISVSGFVGSAELVTESGDVSLEAPWEASRIKLMAAKKPAEVILPDGFKFATWETKGEKGPLWVLEDQQPSERITFGRFQVSAGESSRVTLRSMPIPEDSPVKLPWQAPRVLEAIAVSDKVRPAAPPEPAGATAPKPELETQPTADSAALFTSQVRMVNVTVAVYDPSGHPMTGLKTEDFEIFEDGSPQEIASAASEEVPFNLVLLLDLSGSTKQDREPMKAAAQRFLDIARPQDRVAVYALANDRFYVVSPLSSDREQLRRLILALPEVSGGTPLYDALVLSYAQELRRHRGERNAIIVLSDGVDNQLYGSLTPSEVSFSKLRKAAPEFDTLIYPILLDAAEPQGKAPGWARRARQRMEELAAASGGRLFPARSLQELEPVYPQVENELRSVYTVAYYPKNQEFDGAWRAVQIKTHQPGTQVRSRDGYLALP